MSCLKDREMQLGFQYPANKLSDVYLKGWRAPSRHKIKPKLPLSSQTPQNDIKCV